MGVMSCSRSGCDNIMCDVYVDGAGYVCNDCVREFKEFAEDQKLVLETEGQIMSNLTKFMRTERGSEKKTDIDTFFSSRNRNQETDWNEWEKNRKERF